VAAVALGALAAHAQGAAPAVPSGISLDGFNADISFVEIYDDNIFSARGPKQSDFISVIAPSVGYSYDGSQLDMSVGANAEFGFYEQYTRQDYIDGRVFVDTRYRPSPDLLFVAGASHVWDHEERSSPDDVDGLEPTQYMRTGVAAAVLKTIGKVSVKVGGTYDHLNFDDVPGAAGTINNDDRDRDLATVGTRFTYTVDDANQVYAEFTYDNRDYRSSVDDNGFDRDSDGLRLAAGIRHRVGRTLDAEAYGGWLYQSFEDGRFDEVSTVDLGGRLIWRPMPGTSIRAFVSRDIQETTIPGSSSYLQTGGGLSVTQAIRPDLLMDAGVTYYDSDYQDDGRTDHSWTASLGVRKYITPNVFVGAEYQYENRDSSDISQNYDGSQFMVRLGADTDAAFREDALDGLAAIDFAGLYVGVMGGVHNLATELGGERGNGGTLQADFGDHGLAGDIFAGAGVNVANWYLGLEADANLSDADWVHSRFLGGDGRIFSVDRHEAYGLSAIVGRRFTGGSMFYGRAGATLADFTTFYNHSGTITDETHTELGFRFGIGATAPLTSNLAFRMEYDHTTYDDETINYGTGADTFANNESNVWVGLLYNLQAAPEADVTATMPDFGGFYAGLQIGHGAIATKASGPRDAGSVLTADFADTGLSGGVFAGYGIQSGRVFLGAEGEVEFSDAKWEHERQPTGRTYAIGKRDSYGVSARLGYVVGNAALLYGRAGVVLSNFRTTFHRGMNTTVDDDYKPGLRLGFGMELPATERMTVRLDYTFTAYDDYTLATPSGVERYDNLEESLFRVGTAFRF
jgi:opacity protein-like surface antigen